MPQNAEELLTDPGYRAVIDGLAKEDLLFGEVRAKRPNRPDQIETHVALLKLLTGERKPVFVVEYIDAPQDIEHARTVLVDYGFIPHFATVRSIACASATCPSRPPSGASVPIPKFASLCGTLVCELRN